MVSSDRSTVHDLLVIGGGPAGAATAYWAAKSGLDVVFVERKVFPRVKTCGDGLTPRAITQLQAMGLGDKITRYHRHDGLRCVAHNKSMEMLWPEHPVHPNYGYVVTRHDLDDFVAQNAIDAGATLYQGTEAVEPIYTNGVLAGATVKDKVSDERRDIRAKYVVIADGANSRFGRALGTSRDRSYPMGMAIRGYYESPLHDTPWIESALDVRDRQGNSMPGYGWIFPVGDGTINVGIGLLSTFRDYKSVNTTHMMTEFAATLPEYWQVDANNPVAKPTGGRLPMAGSVGPKVGPNWMAVGDAAGSVNPFNGEGIDYAYETGRMAAGLVAEAIDDGHALAIQQYTRLLDEEYGDYFKVARVFASVIGHPRLVRELTRIGMHSQPLMEWALRVMANLMREDEPRSAEWAYKAIAVVAKRIPDKMHAA
ncbi:MAG: geranylgeranyl reductase family protein [Acidimicrobiales bacterium]|jgi:menaquinone-9 beta-reductase